MPRSRKQPWLACGFRAERASAGDRPPRYGPRSSHHRRARACPSPCLGRGNSRGWRAVFAQSERARGTGPRATGQEVLITVGRGKALAMPRSRKRPRLARGFRADRAIAGDRPPRYGPRSSRHRRARKGPRHASVEETAAAGARFSRRANDRGGQAPALRAKKPDPDPFGIRRARTTAIASRPGGLSYSAHVPISHRAAVTPHKATRLPLPRR